VVVPANRTKQEVPNWVGNAEQDSVYKCICELFEMGARFTRTASGFEVVYPADREIEGKQFESVLRCVQAIRVAINQWRLLLPRFQANSDATRSVGRVGGARR
jgi:hypothetical protein